MLLSDIDLIPRHISYDITGAEVVFYWTFQIFDNLKL